MRGRHAVSDTSLSSLFSLSVLRSPAAEAVTEQKGLPRVVNAQDEKQSRWET